jgi:hypothetical protein
MSEGEESAQEAPAISLADFLENVPPYEERAVSEFARSVSEGWAWLHPTLSLFCPAPSCGRVQKFASSALRPTQWEPGKSIQPMHVLVTYSCKNCSVTDKTYVVRILTQRFGHGAGGDLVKIGEFPPFGPPLPARLQRLVQSERDFLLKGFRSENRGFGIGAFAYYRRVVEDGKNQLIDQVVKACETIPGAANFIPVLKNAREETQFSKAVGKIGEAIPDALKIEGHNPLTLLHRALSRDLHSATDDECLAAANSIRVVLAEFAERMSYITREKSELRTAVSKLFGDGSKSDTATE